MGLTTQDPYILKEHTELYKILKFRVDRPFDTNDHTVQNPPCWRASSLIFLHWDSKTRRPQPVKLDWPLVKCPSAGIVLSLPSSMADFVTM